MTRLSPSYRRLEAALLLLCLALTTYLYCYPLFHRNCAFPHGGGDGPAPFRLLALGDPQLEGDTSIPRARAPSAHAATPRTVGRDLLAGRARAALDGLGELSSDALVRALVALFAARKRADLLGNDLYLAHVRRAAAAWARPTHVAVLGDLLGSQWIGDDEFERRAGRFWGRVFRGARPVPQEVLVPGAGAEDGIAPGAVVDGLDGAPAEEEEPYAPREEVLGADAEAWRRRVLVVPGNHDIGYAGDLTRERAERFERAFGPLNGDIVFRLPRAGNSSLSEEEAPPAIRVVVLNSMNLDGPTYDFDLQRDTYQFVNSVMNSLDPVGARRTALVLLTHVPMHKDAGVCTDAPLFTYHGDGDDAGVREQNMLSPERSRDAVLQGLFGKHPSADAPARGLGRDGVVLTGHDHEGCDVYHHVDREAQAWRAQRWGDANTSALVADTDRPGLREVTVRSMMGQYGGNAALVSAWWDAEAGRWSIDVANCMLGTQHVWWLVHILDLVVIALVAAGRLADFVHGFRVPKENDAKVEKKAAQKRTQRRKPQTASKDPKS
jgi:hypothetical protein